MECIHSYCTDCSPGTITASPCATLCQNKVSIMNYNFNDVMSTFLHNNNRLKAARLTDKRVKVMNEVISGIRVIKMYAWEYAFSHVVAAIRK